MTARSTQPELPPPPTGRSRPLALFFGMITLIGGALGVALLAGEFVVRLAMPQQLILIEPGVWQPRDSVGYTFRANLDRPINTGERTVRLMTDHEGFRVGFDGRPETGARVLLIGDSFFGALQVEYEQSFPGLLQAYLPDRLGRPVAVRNTAVPGWDPPQYLYRALSLLPNEAFRAVVVGVYVGNDISDRPASLIDPVEPIVKHSLRWPRRLTWNEMIAATLWPVNDFLETNSHLFILAKKQLRTLRIQLGLTAEYFPVGFRRSEALSNRWGVTADILWQIKSAGEAWQVPTAFVLIPAPFQVDSLVFSRYVTGFGIDPAEVDLDQPQRLLAAAMANRGLVVVDPLPAFRAAHARGIALFGRIDPHFSPEGHEVLWQAMAPTLDSLMQTEGPVSSSE